MRLACRFCAGSQFSPTQVMLPTAPTLEPCACTGGTVSFALAATPHGADRGAGLPGSSLCQDVRLFSNTGEQTSSALLLRGGLTMVCVPYAASPLFWLQRALDSVDCLEQRVALLTRLLYVSPAADPAISTASVPQSGVKLSAVNRTTGPPGRKRIAAVPGGRDTSERPLAQTLARPQASPAVTRRRADAPPKADKLI